MKTGKTTAIAAALSLVGMPVIAQASSGAGTIRSAQGGVYIVRDGAMIPAAANMELRAGDRVMTRVGGRAEVAYAGCNAPVASASVFTVGATDDCGATARNFASLQDEDDSLGATGAEGSGGFSGGLVAVLAAVAVGLGIYVAVDAGDSNDVPASA